MSEDEIPVKDSSFPPDSPKDDLSWLRALVVESSRILGDDPEGGYFPMISGSSPYRPRDWWNTRNPEHLRAELADVDQALRESGIEYPCGARGVEDLAQFASQVHGWLEEVAVLARERGWEGDFDELAEFLQARLVDRVR